MKAALGSLSNVGRKGRINQTWVLIIAILLGVIVSFSAVDAQDFNKASKRHFKARYKQQINLAPQECAVLNQKRKVLREATESTANYRRPRYKPQAEVDPPRYAVQRRALIPRIGYGKVR